MIMSSFLLFIAEVRVLIEAGMRNAGVVGCAGGGIALYYVVLLKLISKKCI